MQYVMIQKVKSIIARSRQYNDFYIGENADVTIVAGCGIHNDGCGKSEHDGIHTFYIGKNAKKKIIRPSTEMLPAAVIENSLAVDAACSGNPGPMEYRGVHVASRQEIFHFGPMKGTNNIGEFLAIVHGLALLKKKGFDMPIYSDSANAISWVRQKKCKTKLPRTPETEELFLLIERAEKWLQGNTYTTPILKWETKEWGEIPADFGRK